MGNCEYANPPRDSLEQSVRDDLAILRAYPFTRKELADSSIGFVYDLKTGKLTPVKP
jgi:carbonic anhydrase